MHNAAKRHPAHPPPTIFTSKSRQIAGFTLIELSIVLLIIGLIVGGALVGQTLIAAAAVRGQITQIEKFNQAVNTFKGKFGELPGDMSEATAAQFGFTPRGYNGVYAGMGDGNGLIEGNNNLACNTCNYGVKMPGEPMLFWNDLTWANGQNVNFVDGSFSSANTASLSPNATGTTIGNWLPPARIGQGNYVYAWSVNGINYFGMSAVYTINLNMFSNAGLTVAQAYAIDAKVDDGLPQSGNVQAFYIPTSSWFWAYNSFQANGYGGIAPGGTAGPNSLTCYDNGGNSGSPMNYSLTQNHGAGLNCALSFAMQGAGR